MSSSSAPEAWLPTKAYILYNGFLAAGLIWGLTIADPLWSLRVQLFFLLCVVTAATYGAMRSSRSILLKQGLPAILALIALLLR